MSANVRTLQGQPASPRAVLRRVVGVDLQTIGASIHRVKSVIIAAFVYFAVFTITQEAASEPLGTTPVDPGPTVVIDGCPRVPVVVYRRTARKLDQVERRRHELAGKPHHRTVKYHREPTACQLAHVRKALRKHRRAIRKLWRYYRKHQLPRCTWDPESGLGRPPFDPRRYVAKNPTSDAAGKYQFLDSTWHGAGGPDYPGDHDAAKADPLLQERIAHEHYATHGGSPWVNC